MIRGLRPCALCLAAAAAVSPRPALAQQRKGETAAVSPRPLARPVRRGGWIVPAEGKAAMPVWGVDGGIAIGLWPMSGPRGLIRIYAPYLGHPPGRMINYVAVEPLIGGRRGLSELEQSALDGAPGKRMWTTATLERSPRPELPWRPVRPKLHRIGKAEAMTFFVCVEPFAGGARPIVQVTLRQDRPYEVAFRTFTATGGAKMDACDLTATMGNYARLRRLWLKGGAVEAEKLWPGFVPRGPRLGGFARRRRWGAARMVAIGGEAIVSATPGEADPAGAAYDPNVPGPWRYRGRPAVQYWITRQRSGLVVGVNGRTTYWNSRAAIPGGCPSRTSSCTPRSGTGRSSVSASRR